MNKQSVNNLWSLIGIEEKTVIDFGVGESTEKLVKLGAYLIAIDRDLDKIKKYKTKFEGNKINFICCDITSLPFKKNIADLAVFYFVLHEVDPTLHERVLSSAREVSSKIMIVEPSPRGCMAYRQYAKLWRDAMHSIGKFEDYKSARYWRERVKKCNFEIIVMERIKQKVKITFEELEKIFQTTTDIWMELKVAHNYIEKLFKLWEIVKKDGMKWSDLIVIVGKRSSVTN